MGKTGKISLLALILSLLLFGSSQTSYAFVAAGQTHITNIKKSNKLTELRYNHLAYSSAEHALAKHKIKIRYKGGESPNVVIAYFSSRVTQSFTEVMETSYFTSSILSAYLFSFGLRGPPSSCLA